MKVYEKNYIHHDLHSSNIFSHNIWYSYIGDSELYQQLNEKDNPNEILGDSPETLSKNYIQKNVCVGMFTIDHMINILCWTY